MTEEDQDDFDLLNGDVDPLDQLLSSNIELIDDPISIGPNGPQSGIGEPMKIPKASADNMICLRGPCKHLFEVTSYFDAGNTEGSLDHVPKAIDRYCLKTSPNTEVSLVFDCNQWEPVTAQAIMKKTREQKKWLKKNNKKEW